MSNTLRLSTRQSTVRAAASAAATLADLSTGAGAPTLRIYTAPRPATIGGALGAALLLSTTPLTLPNTVVGADIVLTQAEDALITATGEPDWALLSDGNGDPCADMSVGPAPVEPGDPVYGVEINQPTLYAGGYLRLSPIVLTG